MIYQASGQNIKQPMTMANTVLDFSGRLECQKTLPDDQQATARPKVLSLPPTETRLAVYPHGAQRALLNNCRPRRQGIRQAIGRSIVFSPSAIAHEWGVATCSRQAKRKSSNL
jgi:hypothetical protein